MLLPGIDTYFFEVYHSNSFEHGGIGNKDIESILKREGFQPIRFPSGLFPFITIARYLYMKYWVAKIKPGSVVAFQFPLYPRMLQHMIGLLAKKKVNILIILADIDGLKTGDEQLLEKEIQLLKEGTHFIVHGNNMEAWLYQQIPYPKTSQLGPFDFLTNSIQPARKKGYSICFAGNLEKSSFLKQLKNWTSIQFNIYGSGLAENSFSNSNVIYRGSFPPYSLIEQLIGNYGLIWDGESAYKPEGSIGHYQQYIYPHKLSLYILAGLPIIAPAHGGSAEFIKETGIGWLINNLEELPDLLGSIDESSYQIVLQNIWRFQESISNGHQLTAAINKVFRT